MGELDRQVEEMMNNRTFEQFCANVKTSMEAHAIRKGYNEGGVDGKNLLFELTKQAGISAGHTCGEIIYKAVEYAKQPRDVLLEKIAAWAFLEWKYRE